MFNIKKKKKEDDLTYLERAYTAILKKRPNSFLYLPLASVYYRKGNLEKAIKTLQKSISTYPNYASAKHYLAFLYRKNGEIDKAVELFKEVTVESPDNYAAHKVLVEYYLEKKDEKNALTELDELARLAPFDELIRDQINRLEQITPPLIPPNKGGRNQIELPLWRTNEKTSPKNKFLQIKNIKESEKATDQLMEKKDKELPCLKIEEVEKNEAKDEIVSSLENWLKNIDKVSYKV